MHINCIYLNTYQQQTPITGHVDVKTEAGIIKVDFNEDECAEIQAVAVRAWVRKQAALAQAILADTPAIKSLPAPEYAEFTEVVDDTHF